MFTSLFYRKLALFISSKLLQNIYLALYIVCSASISAVAKERPAFYGRVLPVLLGLDPTSSVMKGAPVSGACHALKNAFLSCIDSTYPGAAPVFIPFICILLPF